MFSGDSRSKRRFIQLDRNQILRTFSRRFSRQLNRLVSAAVIVTTLLYLQLGAHAAAPPGPAPAPAPGGGCVGFLCGAQTYLLAAGSPFAAETVLINILFYGINGVIILAAGFSAATAWMAHNRDEPWQPIVSKIGIGAIILFGLNTLVDWVVGA